MSNSEVHSGISHRAHETQNDNFVLAQLVSRTICYCTGSWSRCLSTATLKMATATTVAAHRIFQDPLHQAKGLILWTAALTGRESTATLSQYSWHTHIRKNFQHSRFLLKINFPLLIYCQQLHLEQRYTGNSIRTIFIEGALVYMNYYFNGVVTVPPALQK